MLYSLTYGLFTAAFALSIWTLWSTIAPKLPLIIHLLRYGPIVPQPLPPEPRGSVRGLPVRVAGQMAATEVRAAA